MRREIEVQSSLKHQNIMPVFEYGEDRDWYTMPLADQVLEKLTPPLPDAVIQEFTEHCIAGLEVAHNADYVHRDISPRNIMRLSEGERSRWVIADWGLVRRPRGKTTVVRTLAGTAFGTEGFAAPETWDDAHNVDCGADIYSLGRVVAWAATGRWPAPNLDLLPEGIWRTFVRETTRMNPQQRPANMAAVMTSLRASVIVPESVEPPTSEEAVYQQGKNLLRAAQGGASDAVEVLVSLALTHPDNAKLYFDCVASLPLTAVQALVVHDSNRVTELIEHMQTHLLDRDAYRVSGYDALNSPLHFIQVIAAHAGNTGQEGLLEDAATALFRCEVIWERWRQRMFSRQWLGSVSGRSADVVARVLRHHPAAAEWYRREDWRAIGGDARIRAALGL
jgi:serine/threonine protein kinase